LQENGWNWRSPKPSQQGKSVRLKKTRIIHFLSHTEITRGKGDRKVRNMEGKKGRRIRGVGENNQSTLCV
jgi:hypothetical protein